MTKDLLKLATFINVVFVCFLRSYSGGWFVNNSPRRVPFDSAHTMWDLWWTK
jgi:hypothetical protein